MFIYNKIKEIDKAKHVIVPNDQLSNVQTYQHLKQFLDSISNKSKSIHVELQQKQIKSNQESEEMKRYLKQVENKLQVIEQVQSISLIIEESHLDAMTSFMNIVSKSIMRLQEFSFYTRTTQISIYHINIIFNSLKLLQQLHTINLYISYFTPDVPKAIAHNLNSIQHLKTLHILFEFPTTSSSSDFFNTLLPAKLTQLKMEYDNNDMSTIGGISFGRLLQRCTSLTDLHISLVQSKISEYELNEIGKGLRSVKQLRKLHINISNNELKENDMLQICKCFQAMLHLKQLCLIVDNTYFNIKTMQQLKQSISACEHITHLTFYNRIMTFGGDSSTFSSQIFSEILQSLPDLEYLDVQISKQNFYTILQQLNRCNNVKELAFSIDASMDQKKSEEDYLQIRQSLENIINKIDRLSINFQNRLGMIDENLMQHVMDGIQTMHQIKILSINLTDITTMYCSRQFISSIQNQLLCFISSLKDSLTYLKLNIFKQSLPLIITTLNSLTNLNSIHLFLTNIVYTKLDYKLHIIKHILKMPRLVINNSSNIY